MSIDAFSQAFGATDWKQMTTAAQKKAAALPPPPPPKPAATASNDSSPLTFGDIIDTINPLQHIPLVDALYRRITGDTIRPQGQILGGLLYGGLIGGAVATASVILHETTGVDPEEEILTALLGDGSTHPATTAVAGAPAKSDPAAKTPPVQTASLETASTRTVPTPATSAPPAPTPTAPVTIAEVPATVAPGPAASAPPTPLHPAPKPASATQTAQAAAASIPAQPAPPTHATAENRARQSVATANADALQQLAMDLAAGGQTGGDATPPALAAAQSRPGKMPVRGITAANDQMPSGYYSTAHRRSGYARQPAQVLPEPALPTRPAPPAANATPAATPAPAAAADAATEPPALQVPPPEMISQMMMRNLEKYQAMTRSANRPASQTNYIN